MEFALVAMVLVNIAREWVERKRQVPALGTQPHLYFLL